MEDDCKSTSPALAEYAEQASNTLQQIRFFDFADVVVVASFNNSTSPILRNCFGHSKPKEMLAIVGSSNQVQTALLHVLAGKQLQDRLVQGRFTSNDSNDLYSVVRARYVRNGVPRLYPTCTVEETLVFAYNMQVIESETHHRTSVIDNILQMLHLRTKSAMQVRCLHPAELKRLEIGIELVSSPNLLLVDQPLTGDNLHADLETIHMLQSIARMETCQVVVALAKPPIAIFDAVSSHFVLLSGRGETMSCGNAQDALDYISSKGTSNDDKLSDGDFILMCAESKSETWPKLESCKVVGDCQTPVPRMDMINTRTQFALLFSRELCIAWHDTAWFALRLALVLLATTMTTRIESTISLVSLVAIVPTAMTWFQFKQVVARDNAYSLAPAICSKTLVESAKTAVLVAMAVAVLHWRGMDEDVVLMGVTMFVVIECLSCSFAFAAALMLDSFTAVIATTCIGLALQHLLLAMNAPCTMIASLIAFRTCGAYALYKTKRVLLNE